MPRTKKNNRGPFVINLTGVPGVFEAGKRVWPFMNEKSSVRPEVIKLSERDFLRFIEILDNPPPPSPRLMQLLSKKSVFERESA